MLDECIKKIKKYVDKVWKKKVFGDGTKLNLIMHNVCVLHSQALWDAHSPATLSLSVKPEPVSDTLPTSGCVTKTVWLLHHVTCKQLSHVLNNFLGSCTGLLGSVPHRRKSAESLYWEVVPCWRLLLKGWSQCEYCYNCGWDKWHVTPHHKTAIKKWKWVFFFLSLP